MINKLYVINKYNYPEDWQLVAAEDDLHAIEQFAKYNDLPHISLEEFTKQYNISEANSICGHKIKEIIFED